MSGSVTGGREDEKQGEIKKKKNGKMYCNRVLLVFQMEASL